MPVHLRYQAPSKSTEYITERIGSPKIFLQCDGKSWQPVKRNADDVVVHIPTGQSSVEPLVTSMTVISTIVGSLVVVFFVYKSNPKVYKAH
jgi:hypothetical protein